MPARAYGKITLESTYGVFPTSPTAANEAAIHLNAGNDNMIRKTLDMWTLRSAGASNRKLLTGSERYMAGGKITTPLFGIQAKLLMKLIQGISNASGPTGSPYDLPSFSYQYGIWTDNNATLILNRCLGCKVAKATIKASSSSPVVMLDLDIIAAQVIPVPSVGTTNFPEPGFEVAGGSAPTPPASFYPVTDPFAFQDTVGVISIGGSAVTNYDDWELDFTNFLQANSFENPYVTALYWRGRDVTLTLKKQYASVTDRTNYEAVTALAASFAMNDGTNTGTFTMNGANFWSSIKDDLPQATTYTETVVLDNYLDPSAGSGLGADITYAQTP